MLYQKHKHTGDSEDLELDELARNIKNIVDDSP
jgi:hypothetical protein